MEKNITIIIHTRNEELNIQECIDSASILTDKILAIDMHSTDNTAQIIKKNNVSLKLFPISNYVEPAREFGIKQANTDWVFILDADERMTHELAQEINGIITNCQLQIKKSQTAKPITDLPQMTTHYKVPRKNIFGK